MVGHGGSSAGSYLADPTSPIPSHCASIVATSTVRVNILPIIIHASQIKGVFLFLLTVDYVYFHFFFFLSTDLLTFMNNDTEQIVI